MFCPNCANNLQNLNLDNQSVWHCSNCGGSFFEENGINRISLDSAQKLSSDRKTDEISANEKLCPKDKTILTRVLNDQAVPQDVTLLRCPTCSGIFAYPEDLMRFKQAQKVKVDFFKVWNIPFSPLQNVLVMSFVLLVTVSLYFGMQAVKEGTSQQLKASDILKNLSITASGRLVFVSFKTTNPFRSEIVFTDLTKDTTIRKTISQNPATLHTLTITDLPIENELNYQIVLYDNKGKEVRSEVFRF